MPSMFLYSLNHSLFSVQNFNTDLKSFDSCITTLNSSTLSGNGDHAISWSYFNLSLLHTGPRPFSLWIFFKLLTILLLERAWKDCDHSLHRWDNIVNSSTALALKSGSPSQDNPILTRVLSPYISVILVEWKALLRAGTLSRLLCCVHAVMVHGFPVSLCGLLSLGSDTYCLVTSHYGQDQSRERPQQTRVPHNSSENPTDFENKQLETFLLFQLNQDWLPLQKTCLVIHGRMGWLGILIQPCSSKFSLLTLPWTVQVSVREEIFSSLHLSFPEWNQSPWS